MADQLDPLSAQPGVAGLRLPRELPDMEDFGAPPPAQAQVAEPEPEEDSLAPDQMLVSEAELATLRDTAFNEGVEKGAQEREAALQTQHAADLTALADAFAAESQRRAQGLQEAADAFVLTVTDVVRALTALDGSLLEGMQRDLTAEAASFVATCDGDITVQCAPEDAPRLQTLLRGHSNVQVEAGQDTGQGLMHIVSPTHSIVIDSEQWRKAVGEKIIAAVTALAEQRTKGPERKA